LRSRPRSSRGLAAGIALTLEERREALLTEPARVGRAGIATQERQRDRRVDRTEHLARPGPEAPELVAQLVGQRDAGADEILPRAGERPQRLRAVTVGCENPKPMTVGARELGQHEAVKAVALAVGHAVARAHRLDLVGVHRDHRQARVEQPLDQQPVRALERDQHDPEPQQP
jgi:hypothetical protein